MLIFVVFWIVTLKKDQGHRIIINFLCCDTIYIYKYTSKKEGKDQESIQSSTTPDPGYQWESDNFTIRHHKREPRGQPFKIKTTSYSSRYIVRNAILVKR